MWSGTSMAGPHVVGAVALAWSADRSLIGNIDGTVELFRKTATPKTSTENCGGVSGTSIPNNTFGWGHLDAYKAVATRLK
jgi:subtilisin family serine protease